MSMEQIERCVSKYPHRFKPETIVKKLEKYGRRTEFFQGRIKEIDAWAKNKGVFISTSIFWIKYDKTSNLLQKELPKYRGLVRAAKA